jgi:predicted unusual protein kinase regulating ubiquinone biosynthesis (AarF/ABC1/UbiB family)
VAEAIRDNLRNAELLAVFFQLLRSVVPGLTRVDPREIAREISDRITEELDYRLEASS